ncbi:hypothetical protein GGR54DRAFT_113442 [Hypoxylon sp. NC1633]|nr:hypothetical protein GGR54DRAFT_113442 [Hypoxylon sp. NC1633]
MDPSHPSQPPKGAAYETQGNPATANPSEQQQQHALNNNNTSRTVEDRAPLAQQSGLRFDEAVPSSLGRGIRGGEEKLGRTQGQEQGAELDGDQQMRAPGEGEVASAVERKPGAGGEQVDLAGDLDRKKEEQASKREAVKEERRQGRAPDDGDVRAGVAT